MLGDISVPLRSRSRQTRRRRRKAVLLQQRFDRGNELVLTTVTHVVALQRLGDGNDDVVAVTRRAVLSFDSCPRLAEREIFPTRFHGTRSGGSALRWTPEAPCPQPPVSRR